MCIDITGQFLLPTHQITQDGSITLVEPNPIEEDSYDDDDYHGEEEEIDL